MSRPLVVLGVPHHHGEVHIEFMKSVLGMDKSDYDMGFVDCAGAEIVTSRNLIVQKFLEHPAKPTHLFFVDTDMGIPRDGISKLLSADKPIVSGVAVAKYSNLWVSKYWGDLWDGLHNVQYDACESRDLREAHWIPKDEYRGKVLEIGATGAACILIKREVFEKIPYPWFYNEFNPNASGHKELSYMSEDISFCYKAKKYGIGVHLHLGVLCDHWAGVKKFPPFWEKPKAVAEETK